MNLQNAVEMRRRRSASDEAREQLLAEIPVTERRLELAGVSTAVLEGGDEQPVVLRHGPGEFAADRRAFEQLAAFPEALRAALGSSRPTIEQGR